MSAACDVVFSMAQEADYQQALSICCYEDFGGVDYLESFYHRWLQEPQRAVFIGRMGNRVVALESALVVDGGTTVLLQGLRVVSELRGQGVGSAIQTHLFSFIRLRYPQATAVRLSKAAQPAAENYRLIAKEAVLCLCCEASDLKPFVTELRSKRPCHIAPVTVTQQQAEALLMTDHVISHLLPGQTLIANREPLKPIEANVEVLRRRKLTCVVDQENQPSAISLCSQPYSVTYRQDAMHFNFNIYGRDLDCVCDVFVAQLEKLLLLDLSGYLIFFSYVDPTVWEGLREMCKNKSNVSLFREYCEAVTLEMDF